MDEKRDYPTYPLNPKLSLYLTAEEMYRRIREGYVLKEPLEIVGTMMIQDRQLHVVKNPIRFDIWERDLEHRHVKVSLYEGVLGFFKLELPDYHQNFSISCFVNAPVSHRYEHLVLLWENGNLIAGINATQYGSQYGILDDSQERERTYIQYLERSQLSLTLPLPYPVNPVVALLRAYCDFALLSSSHIHLWALPPQFSKKKDYIFPKASLHLQQKIMSQPEKKRTMKTQPELLQWYHNTLVDFRPKPYSIKAISVRPPSTPAFGALKQSGQPDPSEKDLVHPNYVDDPAHPTFPEGFTIAKLTEEISKFNGFIRDRVLQINETLKQSTVVISQRYDLFFSSDDRNPLCISISDEETLLSPSFVLQFISTLSFESEETGMFSSREILDFVQNSTSLSQACSSSSTAHSQPALSSIHSESTPSSSLDR